MVKIVSEKAPAKVNLYLRVVGQRADGYHELDSVLVPVSLCDELALELRTSASRSVTIRCDRPEIPSDHRNLAARAARDFLDEFGIACAVFIELRKRIPAGAGLGGGSSDAAAVLRALAALFRIDDRERLLKLAVRIGADVPFFVDPRPARIAGIGERILPLENLPRIDLVIAVPPVEVATAAIFRALKRVQWSGALDDAGLRAFASGELAQALLVNDLEAVAAAQHPEILKLKAILQDSGARAVAMSGSGGAVFGIFGSSAQAQHGAGLVRERDPSAAVFAVHTVTSQAEMAKLSAFFTYWPPQH
jgi:4-diphosphocytidyl-2-C-methyl-D-erythritol kinase